MDTIRETPRRRFQLPEMEGAVARWYARGRGTPSQLAEYRRQAARLTEGLPDGAAILEVAPGPGYHAIELAGDGRFRVTGLDISHTMVDIATGNARAAGVTIDFRRGDVAAMPFDADSFDLIVCQAAFKNFPRPGTALNEMYRVLRPGGTAVIQDLRKDVSRPEVDREVAGMELNAVGSFMTKWMLGTVLRRRAYTRAGFEQLVATTSFGTTPSSCEIRSEGIGIEVRLTKPAAD